MDKPAAIQANCEQCGARLRVRAELLGKRVKCPSCEQPTYLSQGSENSGKPDSTAARNTLINEAGDTSLESGQAKLTPPATSILGKFGRYEIQELLGAGAFGRVYKAYDPHLERCVAIKIPTFLSNDQHRVRRFISEARYAARLTHPNIVQVFENGQIDGKYYIATQFVDGETLAARIKREPLTTRQSVAIVQRLAEALAYAHQEGIVHRDIKPENIMLDVNDQPYIMDFGLAKRLEDDSNMTRDGALLGTPAYMSPEQARGELDRVGPASDQYSLGVVLYRMLSGSTPFVGPAHVVIANVALSQVPSLAECGSNVPPELIAICDRLLQSDPMNRYVDCAHLAVDLKQWLAGRPVSVQAVSRSQSGSSLAHAFSQRRIQWALGGLGLAMVLVLVAMALRPGRTSAIADGSLAQSETVDESSSPIEPIASLPVELPEVAPSAAEFATESAGAEETPTVPANLALGETDDSPIHRFAAWILDNGGKVKLENATEIYHKDQLPELVLGLPEVTVENVKEIPDELQNNMPAAAIKFLKIERGCSLEVAVSIFNTNLQTINRASFIQVNSDEALAPLLLASERITDLEFRAFQGANFVDWSELEKYPNLNRLAFYNSSVGNLEFLAKLPRLKKLVLWDLDVSDSHLTPLDTLKELQHLNLGFNSQLTNACLSHLEILQNLDWLSLYKTSISDAGLAKISRLSSLTHISLGETKITDQGLPRLTDLTRLRSLSLNGTSITDSAANLLKNSTVELLNVKATKLSDKFLKGIESRMPQLKKLLLPRSGFSNTLIDHLRRTCPNMMIVHGHEFFVETPTEIGGIAQQLTENLLKPTRLVESWRFNQRVKSEILGTSDAIVFNVYEAGDSPHFVQALQWRLPLEEWQQYALEFQIKSPQKVSVTVVAKIDMPDYHDVGLRERIQTIDTYQQIRILFTASNVMENRNHIALDVGAEVGTVYVKNMTLRPIPRPAAKQVAPPQMGTSRDTSGDGLELDEILDKQLIQNPSNELPVQRARIPHWELLSGNWTQRTEDPSPAHENSYFFAGEGAYAELAQIVNIDSDMLRGLVDTSQIKYSFSGKTRSYAHKNTDTSEIAIDFLDDQLQKMAEPFSTGELSEWRNWTEIKASDTLPQGTRKIRIRLISKRYSGNNNDGYFDDLDLRLSLMSRP